MKNTITMILLALILPTGAHVASSQIAFEVRALQFIRTPGYLDIDVEIRSTGATPFQLGTSTFVFDYNSGALAASGVPSQRKIAANDGPWDAGTDADYADLGTSAPSAGIVSMIVDVSSGDDFVGVEVPSTFTRIGTLRLTISDANATSILAWRNISVNTVVAAFEEPGVSQDMITITPDGSFIDPDDALLPVQMASLTATSSRLTANVRWSTATETENYGFDVERRSISQPNGIARTAEPSSLASTTWRKVGFAEGAGTSNTPREYEFTDRGLQPGRYAYRLKQIDKSGSFTYSMEVEVEVGSAPLEFALAQNYPNPFNPSTTIEFTIPKDGRAVLKIYNMVGEEVAVLANEELKAGVFHRVVFDASRFSSGVYFSSIEFDGQRIVKKMALIK